MTSCDFELVAYAVAVGIVEAVTVAVVTGFWSVALAVARAFRDAIASAHSALVELEAGAVIVGSFCVVVARFGVCTACDFKLVTDAVSVRVIEAVSIAVIAGFRSVSFAVACTFSDAIASAYATLVELEARAVIIGCFGVVVARLGVGTTCDFELVADSVSVCVIEACTFAVVSFVGVFTRFRSAWRYACVLEVEEDAVVVVGVSVDEDLHIQRSREHAVGGDLSEEHLLVVSSYAVGVSVEDEPTASDGVIDGEVTTCFEVVAPWVEGRSDGVDVPFTSCCCLRQTDGYIRVVRCLWEETEEGRCLV